MDGKYLMLGPSVRGREQGGPYLGGYPAGGRDHIYICVFSLEVDVRVPCFPSSKAL